MLCTILLEILLFHSITLFFSEIRQLLTIRPIYKRQADFFDKILKCLTYLIFLMIENAVSEEQKESVEKHVKALVQIDPRAVSTQDSLLHMCVSRTNTIWSSYFIEEEPVVSFHIKNL